MDKAGGSYEVVRRQLLSGVSFAQIERDRTRRLREFGVKMLEALIEGHLGHYGAEDPTVRHLEKQLKYLRRCLKIRLPPLSLAERRKATRERVRRHRAKKRNLI